MFGGSHMLEVLKFGEGGASTSSTVEPKVSSICICKVQLDNLKVRKVGLPPLLSKN